jgi:hypothetical protein
MTARSQPQSTPSHAAGVNGWQVLREPFQAVEWPVCWRERTTTPQLTANSLHPNIDAQHCDQSAAIAHMVFARNRKFHTLVSMHFRF